jgi:hypothetical protein
VPGHLDSFCGFVRGLYGGQPDARGRQLLDRIRYTRLVVGVIIEPGRDQAGRAEQLLGMMANGLDALMYFDGVLYEKNVKVVLAPGGSFDPEADVLGPVAELVKDRIQVELPPGERYQPTPNQQARYERVRKLLALRKVPTLEYPLYVEDDTVVTLREPAEVARRALVLSAVTFLADGGPREQALAMIERHDLWPAASPEEAAFLQADPTDPEAARKLLWRLEGLWLLAGVLGAVELDWPEQMCDVPRLVEVMMGREEDPDFIAKATLRPNSEILDAQQLTLLIHWAVRDAWVHRRNVPENLDWAEPGPMVPVEQSPAAGVVAERHHALNWLTRFGDADWDDVDTPT